MVCLRAVHRDNDIDRALAAKDAELERFTRAVSHDLRNPLVTVRAFLTLLEEDLASDDEEQVASDLEHLRRAVARMERLLGQLVAWSRSGGFAEPAGQVSLREVAIEAMEERAERAARDEVSIELGALDGEVRGHREQLLELYRELIDNALKHMGAGGTRIELSSRAGEDGPVFTVSDDGRGVPPEDLERIFEPFVHLGGGHVGSGLGLPLIRRIVANHRGRIWAEPAGEGRGCTVCFAFD